jgi:hypothetical protein
VVGQRIDKNRKWYLGNEKNDETDNYKIYTIQKLLCSLHYCKFLLRDAIFFSVPHFSTISKKDRHAKLYQMLNIGVSFSSKIINALMYADDVALLAESESDLRKMLKISHDFACKWNLKFNHSKSKVLEGNF